MFGGPLANSLAGDLEGFAAQINTISKQIQGSPNLKQLLLTNDQGQIVAAVGNLIYKGVIYTNFFGELHVGNSLLTNDPSKGVFNANLDGSVSIGENGWLDVHDPYAGNAAWIGTQFDSLPIAGASNNGTGAIRLQVPGHTLATGNQCRVWNMQLAGVPNATGIWTVNVIDGNTVDLVGSVFAGAFAPAPQPQGIDTAAPIIDRVLQVVSVTPLDTLVAIETAVPHDYITGDRVHIDVPAIPGVTGEWGITVFDNTNFALVDSTFTTGGFASGTCLRFFAGVLAQQFAVGPNFQEYKLRAFPDGSLRIRNASIALSSGANSLILDPVRPSIVATSPAGTVVLDGATPKLTFSAPTGLIVVDASVSRMVFSSPIGSIAIDAVAGQITVRNGQNGVTATLDTTGKLTTSSMSTTGGVTRTLTIGGETLEFTGGILTNATP